MSTNYPTYQRKPKEGAQPEALDSVEASELEDGLLPDGDAALEIGRVVDVSGSAATIVIDADARASALDRSDRTGGLIGQIGSVVKVQVADSWVYAVVRSLKSVGAKGASAFGDEADILYAELDFVGQGDPSLGHPDIILLSRGISKFPVPGQVVLTTTDHDLRAIFSPLGKAHIRIGTVYPTHKVPARLLTDGLLSKHFAVLGSTGTGKSSALALLIHRFVDQLPNGHIIILDPHNEYRNAFQENGVHFDTENLSLPYWLMNLEEHIEVFIGRRTADREIEVDILKRCLLAARMRGPSTKKEDRITVDTPVPYRLNDLIHELEVNMGKLEKPETLLPFLKLRNKIEELKNDRRYTFLLSGLLVSDNLNEIVSRLLRFPVDGRPVSTLDLSGVPSDIVDVVVSVLARLVFDFAVWSRKENSRPLLLVCEEAHRYVPEARIDQFGAARKSLERIAKEGRKYGVSLGLISQRPSELSESVLSQCGTFLAMRMNNERDKRFVESAVPEGFKGFLDSLQSLGNREGIICGEGVTAPVRVRFDTLEEERRPSSDDPDFSLTWQGDVNDPGFVTSVLERWRSQVR